MHNDSNRRRNNRLHLEAVGQGASWLVGRVVIVDVHVAYHRPRPIPRADKVGHKVLFWLYKPCPVTAFRRKQASLSSPFVPSTPFLAPPLLFQVQSSAA